MTDNEIIKCAECYLERKTVDECVGCNFLETDSRGFHFCCLPLEEKIIRNLLDLINRQQAEIVKLEAETDRLNYILQCYALEYGTAVDKERFLKPARAEAVKEFAERLKQKETTAISCKRFEGVVSTDDIDNLVKEFTEGKADDQGRY